MLRNLFTRFGWLITTPLFLFGCSTEPLTRTGASGLSQIEKNEPRSCVVVPGRMEMVREQYGSAIGNYDSQARAFALGVLSRLPDGYLKFMFKEHGLKIDLTGYGNTGVTNSTNTDKDKWPTALSSGTLALPHELGHASEGYMWRMHDGFYALMGKIYEYGKANEAEHMRWYARETRKEYFAELYDTFYCSPEAREALKVRFPKTWEFAVNHLLDPVNLEREELMDKKADSDDDGVPDWLDLCSLTAAGATLVDKPGYRGCGGGQYRDVDDFDRDGVVNSTDQCYGTLPGTTVEESGDRAGCVSSQLLNKEDFDMDGVANNKDVCWGTQLGARILDSEEWAGCMSGQLKNKTRRRWYPNAE